MTYADVMELLEREGTAQNRKIYARHGVGEKMFGVSYAALAKLKKQIKTDHGLAERLWASGNHDARILATMIADPARASSDLLDAWAAGLDNYVITDAFAKFAAASPSARSSVEKWTRSKDEWIGSAGWLMLALLATSDEKLPDESLTGYLQVIESSIHTSRNRVRAAMNNVIIGIAARSDQLEKLAIASAKRIGKVEVDHGETGCKTPDAVAYIEKMKVRRKQKAAKRS
jgi:3-methyladenine DNA glycosylase AlkD